MALAIAGICGIIFYEYYLYKTRGDSKIKDKTEKETFNLKEESFNLKETLD